MTLLDPILWLAAGWVVPTCLRRAGASAHIVALLSPVALLASFWPPAAAAWFGVTIYVFLIGLKRLGTKRGLPELCITSGMLYLPVGGFWWLASKWGWQPLGFSGLIVALTGIHFHYAGFAAPVLTGLQRRVPAPVLLTVVLGPPLVGLGIAFSRPLETFSAWLFGAALAAVGWLNWGESRWHKVGAVCVWLSMGLAATYAFGRLTGVETVPIHWMIPTHGLLNVGFVCAYLQSPSSTNGAQ